MTLLVLGIILWCAGHFFKRVAPDLRVRLGDPGKGLVAGILLLGIILMVIGYRGADAGNVYDPPAMGIHINNLLMFFAIVLLGMGSSKGRARSLLRHPMLTGVAVWAIAHLISNGDLASVILFGSMLVWAVAQMIVISRAEGPWQRPEPGPVTGDVKLIVISLVLYAIIVFIHQLVGPWPLPS